MLSREVAVKIQYLVSVRYLTVDLCVIIVPSSVLVNNLSKNASLYGCLLFLLS
jgi:hypothetical protein